jgi:hypothetical protein
MRRCEIGTGRLWVRSSTMVLDLWIALATGHCPMDRRFSNDDETRRRDRSDMDFRARPLAHHNLTKKKPHPSSEMMGNVAAPSPLLHSLQAVASAETSNASRAGFPRRLHRAWFCTNFRDLPASLEQILRGPRNLPDPSGERIDPSIPEIFVG